jgi:mannose-6-phosphate isomerase
MRFYPGGEGISRFRGRPEVDPAPEDWVGSTVHTWDPRRERVGEGLGRVVVGHRSARLIDLVETDPQAWLGPAHVERIGPNPGILVKLLDTAARLPVHCHPSRAFAQRVLDSAFGKTECWVILATREESGNVYLGFKRPIPAVTLRQWIDDQQVDALLEALCIMPVRAGDVLLVPAGMPHSIGPGIFMVEIQEPTDLSIVAERRGFPVREDDARLGLDWEVMIDAFDRRGLERNELDHLRQTLKLRPVTGGATQTPLTGADAAKFFRVEHIHSVGVAPIQTAGFGILLVTSGQGEIRVDSRRLGAVTGDAFAIPAACAERLSVEGEMELLLCRPSESRHLPRVRE